MTVPHPLKPRWWHIVWTTSLVWSPADARGDWSTLSLAYSDLTERHGHIRMSHPLDRRWQGKTHDDRAVELSPFARTLVERSIRELSAEDRVAGDTPIRALAVQPRSVQVVLACPIGVLQQRVGRLKSRTATLLSFEPGSGVGGKGTWSRGFWWSRLEDDAVRDAIVSYVTSL